LHVIAILPIFFWKHGHSDVACKKLCGRHIRSDLLLPCAQSSIFINRSINIFYIFKMRYSFAAAALAATAYAAPVEDIMGRSTFKVPAVRQNTTAHPVLAMAKTYRKYNAQAPADVKAAAAAQSGSVAAYSNEGDVSYLCPVNVGGKTLNLDFDTGSSDLYVKGPSQGRIQAYTS
jgi:hypothetical protein